MEKDIRLYYYENGALKKTSPKQLHRHTSISNCLLLIERARKQKTTYQKQYVIVEYKGSYSSEIIYVTPMDVGKIL